MMCNLMSSDAAKHRGLTQATHARGISPNKGLPSDVLGMTTPSTFNKSSSNPLITGNGAGTTNPKNVASSGLQDRKDLAEEVFKDVNQYRTGKGLSPLKWDQDYYNEADSHSNDMALGKVPFGHDGFDTRAKDLSKTDPWKQLGENVAFNSGYSDPAQTAFDGWLKSPGHLANIEGKDFTTTGVGVAELNGKYYLTQVFGQDANPTA